jgi:MSHA biogenesis protein MshL
MNIYFSRAVLFSSLVFLSACQTQPPKNGTAIDDIREELKQGQQQNATQKHLPPPEISAALMPSIDLNLGNSSSRSLERFDVRVNNAAAREFFMGLVEGTPYNMVVHPDVEGSISLNLKNVSIPEVMNTLRDVYGYEFNQNAAGFQVMPVRLQSRIFYVNYLNLKRTGSSEMSVSSGQITENSSSDSSESDSDSGSSSSSSSTENKTSAMVSTTNEADIWSELRVSLQSIIGSGDGRSITLSPQSGIVVVRAMPAELREIENFLREVQSSLHRQVILEAKIVEVELNDGFQSGINWSKIAKSNNGDNSLAIGQTGGGSIFSGTGTNTSLSGQTGDLSNNGFSAVDAMNIAGFGGVFTAAVKLADFNAFIELLKSQGNVQVLSSPRVATMNNQKAIIKVGQDEYFVTDVSSTTTTGAAASSSTPDITLTPFFSGIALDVTPQIDKAGMVTLHIHPSVSEVVDQTKSLVIDGKAQTLPIALSTVRESDNIVRARNGQLVVIGGLMKNSTTEDLASVPVLGDLPFVGSAFRHTKQSSRKSELVILLRPVVVDSPNVWGNYMQRSSEHIDSLDRGFHVGGSADIFGTEGERR